MPANVTTRVRCRHGLRALPLLGVAGQPCSPTRRATRRPRSPSSRSAPAASPSPDRRGLSVIPLRDDNPTRRFPVVTVVLIALNVAVFVFQLSLPRYGLTLDGFFLRAGLVPYEVVNRVDVPPDGLVPCGGPSSRRCSSTAAGCTSSSTCCICGSSATTSRTVWAGRGSWPSTFCAASRRRPYRSSSMPESLVPMIGASGAIAGVLGAYILLFPRARVLTVIPLILLFPVVMLPAWALLLAWFALRPAPGDGHDRRRGGCRLLRPRRRLRRRPHAGVGVRAPPAAGREAVGMVGPARPGRQSRW